MASGALKDWRDFPPGKEKYQLYLASREWALLRKAVRARSGGACERCRSGPASQVHHQTYERVYAEALDDLVHLCGACHRFLSGKDGNDPAAAIAFRGCGDVIKSIKSIYLAGQINGDCWRDQIAPGWSRMSEEIAGDRWVNDCGRGRVELPDGRRLDLTGPFPTEVDDFFQEVSLARASRDAILRADLIFAWVGDDDFADVIFQLGYAHALGKEIGLFFDRTVSLYHSPFLRLDTGDVWAADSASHAWEYLWDLQEALQEGAIGPAEKGAAR